LPTEKADEPVGHVLRVCQAVGLRQLPFKKPRHIIFKTTDAQKMAAHESPRTTKLYDRTKELLTQDEVERIRL